MTNFIEIKNLNLWFSGVWEETHVLKDINFSMTCKKLGVVGESGSGKSMLMKSILGLIPATGKVTADKLYLDNHNLLKTGKQKELIKNQEISMVSQDPRASLNPVMTIREQIQEVFLNKNIDNAKDRILHSLEEVRVDRPERVLDLYPHEISGGMGQRIMIAMMIAMQPKLLIADEPTSALDACIKHEILHLLEEKIEQYGMKLILISHDLPLVKKYCDDVLVLYKGEVMEHSKATEISHSKHPYVQALMNSIPKIDQNVDKLPTFLREK